MRVKTLWLWKNSINPWCETTTEDEWTPFADIDTEIIEDAYQGQRLKLVVLDTCTANVKYRIQVQHGYKQLLTPIKRIVVSRDDERYCLREKRFTEPLELHVSNSFSTDHDWWSPYLDRLWEQNFERPLCEQVELAAHGIVIEGEKLGHLMEATWLSKRLLEVKNEGLVEIIKRCLYLYTRDSFLYRLLNNWLRKNNETKTRTLGWFGYLLFPSHLEVRCFEWSCAMRYEGVVYRGITLSQEDLDRYKLYVGKQSTLLQWLNYSSTTKNRKLAEMFGNTLFIIDLNTGENLDIAALSHFPQEEEVLVRSAQSFVITDMKYDEATAKFNIYIKLR